MRENELTKWHVIFSNILLRSRELFNLLQGVICFLIGLFFLLWQLKHVSCLKSSHKREYMFIFIKNPNFWKPSPAWKRLFNGKLPFMMKMQTFENATSQKSILVDGALLLDLQLSLLPLTSVHCPFKGWKEKYSLFQKVNSCFLTGLEHLHNNK